MFKVKKNCVLHCCGTFLGKIAKYERVSHDNASSSTLICLTLFHMSRRLYLFTQNKWSRLTAHQWVKEKEAEMNVRYMHALRHIKQQLWCCCGRDGIVVLDTDLQQQRTIPAGDMGYVNNVAEMSSGDVIIAADKGLFHADINGWSGYLL